MDKITINQIIYGVLVAKLPEKQYLEMPSHIISSIADDIVIQLFKEGVIDV